ncbi:MAG TPA: metallophosphoesterase [Sedimentisphaerales bacterium]|nr:metallophosphoesterase [Sedimentisphaerales bacterium]
MPQTTIDLLNKGIRANQTDKFRRGNLICLPQAGSLIVTGDIHGHRRNFERIVTWAALAERPDRHLIFQEIIHGGPEDEAGGCLSYQLLFEVIRFKLRFPDQVHLVMGNHDTAAICSAEVMKNGKEMNRAMSSALDREFRQSGPDVRLAIRQFLFSQPLAVRCGNRLWISHSLPSDRSLDEFDPRVFERELQISDCERPGSAYLLTWGRRHSQPALNRLAKTLDVDVFILGHQPQTTGWCKAGENLIILACDHNHGCLLPIDLSKTYTAAALADRIIPLASIA